MNAPVNIFASWLMHIKKWFHIADAHGIFTLASALSGATISALLLLPAVGEGYNTFNTIVRASLSRGESIAAVASSVTTDNLERKVVPVDSAQYVEISHTHTQQAEAFLPRIYVIGDTLVIVHVGEGYTDDGAYAENAYSASLPYTASVRGDVMEAGESLDTSVPGEHTVVYRTIDAFGHTAFATRIVRVVVE
jgi:hypothetical protein